MCVTRVTSMKQIILLAILMISCAVAWAQKASTLPAGWDLSYSSVLDANGVGPDEWIRKWLGPNYQSPVKGLISAWLHEPIESSILLEHPAHTGERITMWFVRTKTQAYYYDRVETKPPRETNESLDVQAYDNFFNVISKWAQAKPLKPEDIPVGAIPGYSGFLSLYNSGTSRQMLLTLEDFAICNTRQCDTWKPGRLAQALQLVPRFDPESIKHKSETEIAAMTPAERVDEYVKEQSHAYKVSDDQQDVIRRYLWRDGLKAIPRMVEIMNEYDPTNPAGRSDKKGERFDATLMLLSELDGRVVRLRGTVEGRQVIDALARAIVRIRATANGKTDQHEWPEHGRFEGAKMDLESAKGISIEDEAIKDTLWVKYRIKISDKELLAFTNYLILRDPTYPSWSEIEGDIEDFSRLNKEGYPARVNIMKEPDRFYQAYLAFKKNKPVGPKSRG
jgi:hypothetical protein